MFVTAAILARLACDAMRPTYGLEELGAVQLGTDATPWYLTHALLVGGHELTIRDPATGTTVNVVDYLTTERELEDPNGRLVRSPYREDGLPRFPRTDGLYIGEGHPNQFLAILTWAGASLSQPVKLRGNDNLTLADVLESGKMHLRPSQMLAVPPTDKYGDQELGWSISAIAGSLGSDAEWKNKWDEDVSLAALIEIALQRPLGWGSCGGTHELFGLAFALYVRQAEGKDLGGVWTRLDAYIDTAKARARASQHGDGSFDYDWARPDKGDELKTLSPKRQVHITGHMLEWLVVASSTEEITEPFLRKAYRFLSGCKFAKVAITPASRGANIVGYGSLTHAINGMQCYRERMAEQTARCPVAHEFLEHRMQPRPGTV
jgi:hypothetical protein